VTETTSTEAAPGATAQPGARRIHVNRTLNLRGIRAIGFDLDYTLVHYRTEDWERLAFEHARAGLARRGFPVEDLRFDPGLHTLGLVMDRELGNVVKANRFGFVKRAAHGTRLLDPEELRATYARVQVDLSEPRWDFMNTLFSLSEAALFAGLVDLLDAGRLPPGLSPRELHQAVRESLDAAHFEGELKRDILRDPARFVVPDPELPRALLDLRAAGKRLVVITNSELAYARPILEHALDPYLPRGGHRALFDLIVVSARKPDFFTGRSPLFEVVDDTGLLRELRAVPSTGGTCLGGSARHVERWLGCPPEEILYVGDHLFTDVHVTKRLLRWRTALVLRELEGEVAAVARFRGAQAELDRLMAAKEALEGDADRLRLAALRAEEETNPPGPAPDPARLRELRAAIRELDQKIGPLSAAASTLGNPRWGLLFRAGNDKSHLARQVERYADVYTARVANFLDVTPFAFLRSGRGGLPHDPPG